LSYLKRNFHFNCNLIFKLLLLKTYFYNIIHSKNSLQSSPMHFTIIALSINPSPPKGTKSVLTFFQVQFIVLWLLHLMSKFNKTCWKICALSSSLCGKFLDQSKMYWYFIANQSSRVQFEFTKLHLMAATLEACITFVQCLFSIKIYWVMFPLKSSYCGKIFHINHNIVNKPYSFPYGQGIIPL